MRENIYERVIRFLMFILLVSLIIRYASGMCISDCDQLKIIVISAFVFMFVNTYYPYVPINNIN